MNRLFYLFVCAAMLSHFTSCDKLTTEDEAIKTTQPEVNFGGTWEFNFSEGWTATRQWYIGKENEFTWKDSNSYSYLDENGRTKFDKDFYEITGNISDEGKLLAIVYLSDSNPKKKCGDFAGNLNNKNGVGSFNYKISTRELNSNWTAFKK